MSTLLVENLSCIATVDDAFTVLDGGGIYVEGNRIVAVGRKVPSSADTVIDGRGMIAVPGMINTHHHLFQTLTRNIPIVQDAGLFDWLVNLYEIWAELTPEAVFVSTQLGLGELLLTGCTASTDMFYVFPKGTPADLFDQQIHAARQIGARFMPCRGSMSRGRSEGGLPPDAIVQDEQTIVADCERVVAAWHERDPLGMIKIALAPCSPFSVTPELLRETARMSHRLEVGIHTHLAETLDEDAYCDRVYGRRPFAFMDDMGWSVPRAWYAHSVWFNEEEIERAARHGVGVAHCPTSNFRLGSGQAPIAQMVAAGVKVGLGVDGSASNDSSDMLGEVRSCMWAQRARLGPAGMNVRQALRLATRGGAQVLGFPTLGSLQEGWGADFFLMDLSRFGYAGALHDPVAAIVFSGFDHTVDYTVVNGQVVVADRRLVNVDGPAIAARANEIAAEMVRRASARTGIDFLSPVERAAGAMDAGAVLESAGVGRLEDGAARGPEA
jgi:cytosine/adenosine deaminase-related metal-dependent hydrolase